MSSDLAENPQPNPSLACRRGGRGAIATSDTSGILERRDGVGMHEQSIALNILDVAANVAAKQNARVVAVHLRLGPLAGVIKEALQSAWARVRGGSGLAGSRLETVETPLVIWCPKCEADRSAISPQDLHCAECGAPAKRVVTGRELEIMTLEV